MDKHIINIQNFVERKVQRAKGQIIKDDLNLARKTLAEINKDILTGIQLGFFPSSLCQAIDRFEVIRDKLDWLNRNERRIV